MRSNTILITGIFFFYLAQSYLVMGQQSNHPLTVLHDQTNAPYSNIYGMKSQMYQNFNNSVQEASDDIEIPPGVTWQIDSLYMPGILTFNGRLDSVVVRIYEDSLGMPFNLAFFESEIAPLSGAMNPDLLIALPNPPTLSSGIYWITVLAHMPSTLGGWYWKFNGPPRHGNLFVWRDPDDIGGNGSQWDTWTYSPGPSTFPDLMFRLYGKETTISGISEHSILPSELVLKQNYPNPFNPTTMIEYQIAKFSDVKLIIYNNFGQKVKTLINKKLTSGMYFSQWDGTNEKNEKISSGIYYYQLNIDNVVYTRKMLLIK